MNSLIPFPPRKNDSESIVAITQQMITRITNIRLQQLILHVLFPSLASIFLVLLADGDGGSSSSSYMIVLSAILYLKII